MSDRARAIVLLVAAPAAAGLLLGGCKSTTLSPAQVACRSCVSAADCVSSGSNKGSAGPSAGPDAAGQSTAELGCGMFGDGSRRCAFTVGQTECCVPLGPPNTFHCEYFYGDSFGAGGMDGAARPDTRPSSAGGAGGGVIVIPVDASCAATVTCAPPGGSYCGRIDNGCRGTLECGPCQGDDWTCEEGICVGGPACVPLACRGEYCGTIGDGCGRALDCGACPGGQTCGAVQAGTCSGAAATVPPPPQPPPPQPRSL